MHNPTNIVKCLEILKPEGESIMNLEQRSHNFKEINEFTQNRI